MSEDEWGMEPLDQEGGDDDDFEAEKPVESKSKKKPENKEEKKTSKKRPAAEDSAKEKPTKKAKTSEDAAPAAGKAVSDTDAVKVIQDYMLSQNRPYSYLTVWENLHRTIKKASVPRILDQLTEQGVLAAKVFGKAKLYQANQDNFETADQSELDRMDAEINELKGRLTTVRSDLSGLQAEVDGLTKEPSNEEADQLIEALETKLEEKTAKMNKMKSSAGTLSKSQVDKINKIFSSYHKEWKKRKRVVMDVVDQYCEASGKKKAQAVTTLGIETDEECGLNDAAIKQLDALMSSIGK